MRPVKPRDNYTKQRSTLDGTSSVGHPQTPLHVYAPTGMPLSKNADSEASGKMRDMVAMMESGTAASTFSLTKKLIGRALFLFHFYPLSSTMPFQFLKQNNYVHYDLPFASTVGPPPCVCCLHLGQLKKSMPLSPQIKFEELT